MNPTVLAYWQHFELYALRNNLEIASFNVAWFETGEWPKVYPVVTVTFKTKGCC